MALGLALLAPAQAPAALTTFAAGDGSFTLGLNGTDRTTTFTFRIATGNPSPYDNGGFHVTISAPDLSDGASHTLPLGPIESVAVSCAAQCAGTPVNSVGYPLAIPTGAPATFFNAAAGTGLGYYYLTPTVDVSVPANTHAGTYSTTITTAIVSGP
jgi:hypothetical protein